MHCLISVISYIYEEVIVVLVNSPNTHYGLNHVKFSIRCMRGNCGH